MFIYVGWNRKTSINQNITRLCGIFSAGMVIKILFNKILPDYLNSYFSVLFIFNVEKIEWSQKIFLNYDYLKWVNTELYFSHSSLL